jgi:hypothetical protein
MTAAAITFAFGAAGAAARECACVEQPDMTAFGFLINPKPTCDRDFVTRDEDGKVQHSCQQPGSGDSKE